MGWSTYDERLTSYGLNSNPPNIYTQMKFANFGFNLTLPENEFHNLASVSLYQ